MGQKKGEETGRRVRRREKRRMDTEEHMDNIHRTPGNTGKRESLKLG